MSDSDSFIEPKWPILILAIAINSTIISLFYPSPVIRALAGASVALLVILFTGILFNNYSNEDTSLGFSDVTDTYRMTIQYLKFNRKYILTSAIGLIIAILVISQSLVMMSSYQQHAFESYTEGSDLTLASVNIDNVNQSYYSKFNSFLDNNIHKWGENRNLPISHISSYQTLDLEFILAQQSHFTRYVDTHTVTTRQWNLRIYNILSQMPSFPDFDFRQAESVLVIPDTITKAAPEFGYIQYDPVKSTVAVNNSYEMELLLGPDDKPLNSTDHFSNITSTVDHIWKWTSDDRVYLRENQIHFPENVLTGTIFTQKEKIVSLRNTFFEENNKLNYSANSWGARGFEVKVYSDIPRLDKTSLSDYRQRVEDFMSIFFDQSFEVIIQMEVIKYPDQFSSYRVRFAINSPLELVLDDFLEYDNNFQSLMQFSITPLILISLFLFYFSLNIVEDRKLRYFKKLRGRGLSTNQSTAMIFGEILSYAIIAPIIVFPLIKPVASYFLSGSLFIVESSIPVVIPVNIVNQILILSFLFAIDFNLPFILSVYNASLNMNETKQNTSESLLERGNYDLILLFLAALYWLFVPFISVPSGLQDLIFKHLGYVALAMTIIASPIFVSRFLIGKLDRLFNFVEESDETQVAIRSIQLNKRFTRKIITLLIIATMFTYMGIVASTTLSDVNDEMTHYQLGSDMYIEGVSPSDTEYWEKLEHPDIQDYAHISRFTYRANGIELRPGERFEDVITYEFLGVHWSTLAKVLYWDKSYADTPLQPLIDSVRETPHIAMQENTAKALNLDIGEEYDFRYGYESTRNYTLKLTETFTYFPMLVTDILSDDNVTESRVDKVQILTSNDLVNEMARKASRRPYNGALIKLEDGADRDKLRSHFYAEFAGLNYLRVQTDQHDRVSMFNAGGSAGSFSPLARFEEQFFQSSLNLLLVTSLLVTLMGMGYYSFVTMTQRKQEIGLFRALGMVSDQVFAHLVIEILLLVLTSILFSGIVGSYISGKVFRIITGNVVQTIPPFRVRLPIFRILGFTILMIFGAILITVYPSHKLANDQTGDILR